MSNNALISVPELAELLGKSPGSIYRDYRKLRLPFVKIGGAVRFRRASVDEWLAKREAESLAGVSE